MNLTLPQTSVVTFDLEIFGSSAEPDVSLRLKTTPELTFKAQRLDDGWSARVDVPGFVEPGTYSLQIVVVLLERVFTPLKVLVDYVTATTEEATPTATIADDSVPIRIFSTPVKRSSLVAAVDQLSVKPKPLPKPLPKPAAKTTVKLLKFVREEIVVE